MKKIMIVVFCAVSARAAAPSFDSAADMRALVVDLKGQAGAMSSALGSGRGLPPSYWVEGCGALTFSAESGALSEPVKLESVQYQEFCQGVTRDGLPDCWTDRVRVESRTVRIRVDGRGPLQGREKEVFKVCLMETELQVSLARGKRGYDFVLPKRSFDPIVARARSSFLSY
jgi:hypothetical protein